MQGRAEDAGGPAPGKDENAAMGVSRVINTINFEARAISERLSGLPAEQFEIAPNMISKLSEAFASSGK